MSDQEEKDSNAEDLAIAGANQSPETPFYYRQTIGLKRLREKSPDQLAREEAQANAHKGAWDLQKLRQHMAERGEDPLTPPTTSNPKRVERKREISRIDPERKMLDLGRNLFERFSFSQPPEEFSVDCIAEDLDILLKSASVLNIWRAFKNLSGMQQRILNKHYEVGLSYSEDEIMSFLPDELQTAIARFQMNLIAILAFFDSQKTSESIGEGIQTKSVLINKPPKDCPALSDQPGNPMTSPIRPLPEIRPVSEFPIQEKTSLPKKREDTMDDILPRITLLLGYSTASKLKKNEISATPNLLGLSSRDFENLKLDARTIRTAVEKMLEAGYFFSDGQDATKALLARYPLKKCSKTAPIPPSSPDKGVKTMPPSGRKKLKGITALLQNQPLVNKLRAKDIKETEQLVALTSAQLIDLIPVNKGNNFLSVRAIAMKLDKYGYHLADGPEATRHLFNYHPQTYKPLLETPEPDTTAPPGKAETDPKAAASAAAGPPPPGNSAAAATDPASFEGLLGKLGSALDSLTQGDNALNPVSFSGNFKGPHGKDYAFTISEITAPSAE